MSKHTPGTWQRPHRLARTWGVYSDTGAVICKVEREADARLIASAPELLAALSELLALAPAEAPGAGVITGIRERHAAAIASARRAIRQATEAA